MATLIPFDPWVSGTNQNSIPANDNAMRAEVLAANVISDTTTAQPGSPADGDLYIIPAAATGTQWATFAVDSLAYFMGGTWYEFVPYEGLLKVVAGEIKIFNGSGNWELYAGGGGGSSVNVQDEGSTVVTSTTAINFVGAGVTATNAGGGVATVTIPGGGGGSTFVSGSNAIMEIRASDNSPSYSLLGYSSAPAGAGVVSGVTTSATNAGTATPRVSYSQVTPSTTNVAGARMTNGTCFIGSGTAGGFVYAAGWMVSQGATNSSHRVFCGLQNANANPTDVNPSTLVNILGFGYDSTDSTVHFFHNDGSGTATKVNTGISKPTTNNSAAFMIRISCNPGGSVSYSINEIVSGTAFSGTASTDIPGSTTLLRWGGYMSVGGVSSAVGIDFFGHAITIQ